MLKTFVTECNDCVDLLDLLCQIDEKLMKYAKSKYTSITLMIECKESDDFLKDLLHYKRIITKKLFFPSYAPKYSMYSIISRVKILLSK